MSKQQYCGNCTHLIRKGVCKCHLDKINPVIRDVGDWCKAHKEAKGTYGGSVVVKKIHLLNMIENMKSMFRSNVSKDSKMHLLGQQMAYENMLNDDISTHDWNFFIAEYIWYNPWTSGVKPSELFDWLEES